MRIYNPWLSLFCLFFNSQKLPPNHFFGESLVGMPKSLMKETQRLRTEENAVI